MVQSSTPRICDHQVTINIGADSSSSYVRRLAVFDTTMVVVGGIIGAGIFLNPAIVAQRVHTTAFILAAWIIGGAIALIGALTFAELGARRPQAGGGYIYHTGDLIGPGERGERCPDSSRFTRFFTRFSRQIRPSLQKKHGTDTRFPYET